MKDLEHYSLEQLKELKELLSFYTNIGELNEDVDKLIQKLEEKKITPINVRFNLELMEKLQILEPSELKLVKEQGITNLQQLLDCNLDLIPNIPISMKKSLAEKRIFYDLSYLEENKKR